MADQPEAPLVPPEVDLRGHDWMPLYGERLFSSTTWIESSNEGRVAALRLWWHSFAKEKPAASLPDNDRLLAVYAGYGEVVRAWKKIKAEVLRGWVLCSDGRWYHRVVAEIAMESWQRQQDHQESNAAKTERQRRWRERLKALTSALRAAGKTPPKGASLETLEKMARDAGVDVYEASGEIGNTGQDRTGQEKKEQILDAAASSVAAGDPAPETAPPVDRPQAAMVTRADVDAAYALFVPVAYDLRIPDPGFLNTDRRSILAARLAECGGVDGWKLALENLRAAEFLRDEADPSKPKHWVNLANLLKPENFTGLMEGRYAKRHADSRSTDLERARAGIDQATAGGSVPDGGGTDAYLDRTN